MSYIITVSSLLTFFFNFVETTSKSDRVRRRTRKYQPCPSIARTKLRLYFFDSYNFIPIHSSSYYSIIKKQRYSKRLLHRLITCL